MKSTAIVSVFVLCCSLISSAISLDPLHGPVGKVADFAHHNVQKRQTGFSDLTTQDIIDCTSTIVQHQCSSGYAQGVADVALGCRNQTFARHTANTCARSEGGEFCGFTTLRFFLDQTQSTNAATCAGAVTRGVCSSTCRNFLETGRSRLGCCINTYINTTDSPLLAVYSTYLDYRLWNLCNVALPAADCGNSPVTLNPPANAQTCTFTELISRSVRYECMRSVGQPLVDALLPNRKCYVFAKLLADACASNANGRFCAEVIGTDLLSSANTDPLLTSLVRNCVSSSTCSSSCRSTVTNIASTYGCCVNVYNNSDIGLQFPSLSYGVWNSCGVDSPGFCNSTLSGSTTIQAFAWITFVAIAIASYMN